MRYDANILKTALLGTQKSGVELASFPAPIQEHIKPNKNPQTLFLDAFSLYRRYLQSGKELAKSEPPTQTTICEEDTLAFITPKQEHFFNLLIHADIEACDSFLPKFLDTIEGAIIPPTHLIECEHKIKKRPYYRQTLHAFGNRGRWLYHRLGNDNAPKEILDMSLVERKNHYQNILHDRAQTIEFLDEVFDGESITNQFYYIKTLYNRFEQVDSEFLAYFDAKVASISSKSKTYTTMVDFLKFLHLCSPTSKLFENYFASIFSQIWQVESKGLLGKMINGNKQRLKLKSKDELETLLAPLQELVELAPYSYPNDLVGVDKTLYFIIATVPIESWCAHFELSHNEILDAISNIKPMVSKAKSTNAIEKLNYLEALSHHHVKYKQKDIALELFQRHGFAFVDREFLRLLDDQELFETITKHIAQFERYENLLQFIAQDLNITTPWSIPFTKIIFTLATRGYIDNNAKANLWRVAPYLPDNLLPIIQGIDKNNSISSNLYETFMEIERIKEAYKNLDQGSDYE
jgi:hypothetical protein